VSFEKKCNIKEKREGKNQEKTQELRINKRAGSAHFPDNNDYNKKL
jgi:hypothetical protein